MNEKYYEIYEGLYDSYRRGPLNSRLAEEFFFEYGVRSYFQSIRWTTIAIEKSISRLSLFDRVRPDAKHFLLVNLHQLVMLPILLAENGKMDHQKLREMLDKDVALILKTAEGKNENYNQNEGGCDISGRVVLETISNIWGQLELNSLEVWG